MSQDMLHMEEIKEVVRDAYRSLESTYGVVACQLYSAEELARVPWFSQDLPLGVANHLRHAEIDPGSAVLDLGCGAGIDTVLAGDRAGPGGTVYALDFLPEMLERTAKAAAEAGLANVELVEGEMEAMPLPDDSVDVIVSNGVINLSPRKARVMAECARVLRPGGASASRT